MTLTWFEGCHLVWDLTHALHLLLCSSSCSSHTVKVMSHYMLCFHGEDISVIRFTSPSNIFAITGSGYTLDNVVLMCCSHFWHAPLWMCNSQHGHHCPEWPVILSHMSGFVQAEVHWARSSFAKTLVLSPKSKTKVWSKTEVQIEFDLMTTIWSETKLKTKLWSSLWS